MVTNQMIHQESVTASLHLLTSNPGPLPPKTSPLVSDIMGRLNHCDIDNGNIEVHSSEFPVESNSNSVPDPDATPIKSIDDYEMDHLLKCYTQNMIMILWMLTYKCFRIDWWSPLLQTFI